MRASKEEYAKARERRRQVQLQFIPADSGGDELCNAIREFLDRAERKLPSEKAFDRDAKRKRERATA